MKTKTTPAPLTNIAFIRAKAGSEAEVERRLLALVEPSRAEPGCLHYDLHRSTTNPAAFCAYEIWHRPEDLESHFRQPHMLDFVKRTGPLLDGPLDLQSFVKISPAPV